MARSSSASAAHDEQATARLVRKLLEQDPVDVARLREVAAEHGLVSAKVRSRAWPKLLAVNPWDGACAPEAYTEVARAGHPDAGTVRVDVERSAWLGREARGRDPGELRRSLEALVNGVVCSHPGRVHYYQGLHDVAAVLLLVCGEQVAFGMLERLVHAHFRDCVQASLDPTVNQLRMLLPLLERADAKLHAFLVRASGDAPLACHFAVSWMITWFAHSAPDLAVAMRLFDFFIVSHPLAPLYIGVAALVAMRDELMAGECEIGMVHMRLAALPSLCAPLVNGLVRHAREMMRATPPDALRKASRVGIVPDSALRTWPFEFMQVAVRPDRVLKQLATPFIKNEGWKAGQMDGRGTYVAPGGDCYQGDFSRGMRHGRGRFTWKARGERYEGEWRNDRRDGFGVHTWADGATYEGQWRDNRLEGWGVYTWPEGRRYEGSFKADRRDGQGIMTAADGSREAGEWREGRLADRWEVTRCMPSVAAAANAAAESNGVVSKLRQNLEGLPAPLPSGNGPPPTPPPRAGAAGGISSAVGSSLSNTLRGWLSSFGA